MEAVFDFQRGRKQNGNLCEMNNLMLIQCFSVSECTYHVFYIFYCCWDMSVLLFSYQKYIIIILLTVLDDTEVTSIKLKRAEAR